MIKIPAGTFLMGSPEYEEWRYEDEGPQHEVTINYDFALGRYPVTFQEYDHFCELTSRRKARDCGWGRGRLPVIDVSHQDAKAYCDWLSDVTRANYRLPTEAEWEYACRARTRSIYAFGDYITEEEANFWPNIKKTTEVGAYPANDWNLYDMHGNVWEWCSDGPRTYEQVQVADPKGTGSRRVLRGGSWYSEEQNLRSAARYAHSPIKRSDAIGFRVARVQGPAGQD
jgi:formylglycine-generating enzyme required for sulfatase activity